MTLRRIFLFTVSAIALTAASLWIGEQAYSWFPPQAAAESHLIDELFSFLTTLGAFIFLGVTGTLLYAVFFHRAAKYDYSDGPHIEGNITLEIVWTAIPILLVVWIAAYSYQVYDQMAIRGPMEMMHIHLPKLGMEVAHAAPWSKKVQPVESEEVSSLPTDIEVTAKQWAWIFTYPEKNFTSSELHLPTNQRVKLTLKSEDVLHGFYIPEFRVKQDIIPKQDIDFEFTPIRPGSYTLTDSQFSGTYFAANTAKVVVESPEDYKRWLSKAASHKPTPAPNQAAEEYAAASHRPIKTGWATVVPAAPPLVNYPG
ncbi:cytochrome c oxidase subunit II [Calothrix sp. 336/3]|uniref:cytochrome c oxidase subunit II n=1 Tax=Calothrix sp. 336/3 TaxID=1337936 RepID=UPI0004E3D715|nr:cytochrome c oxidase subunit II [Calothrix sp. 336/3]AKG22486.1 cytochrome C oxidase subunit II [Calothrix sp. 336/3]